MADEHLTEGTQPSAEDVPAEGGEEAGSQASGVSEEVAALSLDEINTVLGKQYKDKETALKSLKDMSSQAGKVSDLMGRGEKMDDSKLKELELEVFFARNPEHESNKEVLEALATKHGVSVKDAVDLPAYKNLSEKVRGYEEAQESRTVVDSNRRTQAPEGREDDFQKAQETGDWASFVLKHHMKLDK